MCFNRTLLVLQGSECESVKCCMNFGIALTKLGSLVASSVRLSNLGVSWKLLEIATFIMKVVLGIVHSFYI